MHDWGTISGDITGFMKGFAENIREMELRYPGLIPNIRKGNTIFIGSDYGGQHRISKYETFGFLMVDFDSCTTWERLRRNWRAVFLNDRRRLSYKSLNDKRCREALWPFLSISNSLQGIIVAILFDKRIETIFAQTESLPTNYAGWKKASYEKLMRTIHFVSLFLAGLSRPYQNVIWITDEDEIVANESRLRQAVNLFGTVSSHYLVHTLGHFRWGTTKLDSRDRQLEDLVSIADLVCGSLSAIFTEYKNQNITPQSEFIIPPPQNLPQKISHIMNWFSDNNQTLKKIVYLIEPLQNQTGMNLKHIRFHGSNDFPFT